MNLLKYDELPLGIISILAMFRLDDNKEDAENVSVFQRPIS